MGDAGGGVTGVGKLIKGDKTMKAIVTKFHGPTYSRGSRYRATDSDKNSVTISSDLALNDDANHIAAAMALCKKDELEREAGDRVSQERSTGACVRHRMVRCGDS